MDLRQMARLVEQWWWLLLLGPLLAGVTAYAVSSRQEPMYAARATLQVNPAQSMSAFDATAVLAGNSLANTYRELVLSWPVLQPVVEELGLPHDVEELQDQISVSTKPDTRLIVVEVSGPDARWVAAIANAVGYRFSAFIAEQATQINSSSRGMIDQQITDITRQIDELRLADQTLEVRANLNQLQLTYNDLLVTAQTMDLNAAAARSQITVPVPAVPPDEPYAPRVLIATLLGLLPSLLICGGAIGMVEFLGNGGVTQSSRPRSNLNRRRVSRYGR